MNNNNNNQNNNYVTPEKVDLSKVTVDQTNATMINRERDNIISATIQANEAIDEKKAKTVNNSIKVRKRNPIVSLLIGLFFIGVAGGLAFAGYRLLDDFIQKDDAKHTTTTTTTQKVNNFELYVFDKTRLRKFQGNDQILILLPTLTQNDLRYIYITTSASGIIKREEGTYTIQNRFITLTSTEATHSKFEIQESALEYGDLTLNMYDQEVKYYVKKSPEIESLLIINGTANNTFAYMYELGNHNFYDFTESATDITLVNGPVFVKEGININNNGNIYEYGE